MLKTRILTSALLIPGFLAALFLLPEVYWSLFILLVCSIGIWEWAAMAGFSLNGRIAYTGVTLSAGLVIIIVTALRLINLESYAMFWGILAATCFWMLVAPMWLVTRVKLDNRLILGLVGWVLVLPVWLSMVSLRTVSPWLLLGVIFAVWVADSAAYFAGKRFGKHKLAPLISPGKTWEGVFGAWVAVSIYGAILCYSLKLDYWLVVGLWGLTVLSIMGDLLESLVKRQAGVKDSGNLLPGHGGLLDRIDGLTSSLPLATFFVYFPLFYTVWYSYV